MLQNQEQIPPNLPLQREELVSLLRKRRVGVDFALDVKYKILINIGL